AAGRHLRALGRWLVLFPTRHLPGPQHPAVRRPQHHLPPLQSFLSTAAARGDLLTEQFDYLLPRELIAQAPAEPRDAARLLVLERSSGRLSHRSFADLDRLLQPGDLLVANRTRVLSARLVGRRVPSGGRFEALLLRVTGPGEWE